MSGSVRTHAVEDILEVEKADDAADAEQTDPGGMHRTALPGMSQEQTREPDDDEQRDYESQALHVVDEQKGVPTRRPAVQLMLQPQKTEGNRREAQQQAALVVAGPLIGAGDERADHGEQPEDQELAPKAEPRPECAFRVIGPGTRLIHFRPSAGDSLAHFRRTSRCRWYNSIVKGQGDVRRLSPAPQPSVHPRLEPASP